MRLHALRMGRKTSRLRGNVRGAAGVKKGIEGSLGVHHDLAAIRQLNGHIGTQHLVVLVPRGHLLGKRAVLHHSGVFHTTLQLQFAPVAASLRSPERRDQLRSFVLQCVERGRNGVLDVLDEGFHLKIRARTLDLHLAGLFVETLERGSKRVQQILDRQFLGLQSLLRVLRVPSQFLFRNRQKGLSVGAESIGGGSFKGCVEVRLHLCVLCFFIVELLLGGSQFFCLRSQFRDFFFRGLVLFPQSGFTRFGQLAFVGQCLIELDLRPGAPLAESRPKTE